jgi:hypothetical protein
LTQVEATQIMMLFLSTKLPWCNQIAQQIVTGQRNILKSVWESLKLNTSPPEQQQLGV